MVTIMEPTFPVRAWTFAGSVNGKTRNERIRERPALTRSRTGRSPKIGISAIIEPMRRKTRRKAPICSGVTIGIFMADAPGLYDPRYPM
jgi:hypothetical protein